MQTKGVLGLHERVYSVSKDFRRQRASVCFREVFVPVWCKYKQPNVVLNCSKLQTYVEIVFLCNLITLGIESLLKRPYYEHFQIHI